MNNNQNKASGVTYVDRLTRQVKEVRGKTVILCAQALESTRRYFEVEAALAKKPTNRALRREFKELKKYQDFLKKRLREKRQA